MSSHWTQTFGNGACLSQVHTMTATQEHKGNHSSVTSDLPDCTLTNENLLKNIITGEEI
jgi:hypothetical protein